MAAVYGLACVYCVHKEATVIHETAYQSPPSDAGSFMRCENEALNEFSSG